MGQLASLNVRPGVVTDATDVGAEPYWHDANLVRFRNGLPEQFGGWQQIQTAAGDDLAVQGAARAIHDWSSLDGQTWTAIGTHLKLYLVNAGYRYDITPLRASGQLVDVLTYAAGETTVTVAHAAHGVATGDFVHFSATDDSGADAVTGEYRVAEVVDIDTYQIELDAPATADATGGGTVDFAYEIHVGARSRHKIYGFGVGAYGQGPYGTPRAESNLYQDLRVWSLDNWGEDLMACAAGGPVYYWDRSANPSTRAVQISAAPITNAWVSVSPEDRHLVCFGAHTGVSPDPMLIRWSDQEDFNTFTPALTNTSGDKRLDAGSAIITAIDTRGERLVFTDEALYAMQFIGGNAVFGFEPLGQSVTIIGANAAAQVNGVVYFMGSDGFFVYDGVLRTLACPVRDHVFDDINTAQGSKTYACVNRLFTEIIWFYPAAGADENDRYVVYNYREQNWYFGQLGRAAMHDQSAAFGLPYAIDPDGRVFLHESGTTADGDLLASFIESYDVDIGAGDTFMHIRRLIPDFVALTGEVEVSLVGQHYPAARAIVKGPYPVTAATRKVSVRARARQIALRVAASQTGSDWRMGAWRAEVVPHGRR